MTKSVEDILGKIEVNQPVPGSRTGEAEKVRYVSFDRTQDPNNLFSMVVRRIDPPLMKHGGVVLEPFIISLPDKTSFYALQYHKDVQGWQKQIEYGAAELNLLTARIEADMFIVSDGRSYSLSQCAVERV